MPLEERKEDAGELRGYKFRNFSQFHKCQPRDAGKFRVSPTILDQLEIVERHVRPGGRLLDVVCGAGREAIGFARAGFSVLAIDLAPGMIEAARENARRAGLAIEFRVQSATELADPPGSFDGAFCTGVFSHYLRRGPAPRRLPVQLAQLASRLSGSDWRPEYGDVVSARHDAPVVQLRAPLRRGGDRGGS